MSTLTQRFNTFCRAIRPTKPQLELVKSELDFLDDKLGSALRADESMDFVKTLRSGSYAKQTMLRRVDANDFDADLGIYVRDAELLSDVLERIEVHLHEVYRNRTTRIPHVEREAKSAVRVAFIDNPKINIDLVPIVAVGHDSIDNWGYIPRRDGELRSTSVTGHVDFVRRRNRRQHATAFNKLVSLFKWWRIYSLEPTLVDSVSSFTLSLIVAKAFDDSTLSGDWLEDTLTLAAWVCFHRLQAPIAFEEEGVPAAEVICKDPVQIFDPYNLDNNVAHAMTELERRALVESFDRLADRLQDAINEREHDEKATLGSLDACLHNFRNWSVED